MDLSAVRRAAIKNPVAICAARTVRRSIFAVPDRLLEAFHGASARWSRRVGVTTVKRSPELIVSLTTVPQRIGKVSRCIDSLLGQSVKPDRIILWLSESNLPGLPKVVKRELPPDLVGLEKRGLELRWVKDIGSYRKIVPALTEFPRALIVTADDDILYPRDWLQMLYEAHIREPGYIHCHRAHLIRHDKDGRPLPYRDWDLLAPGIVGPSHDLMPTSGGGVLYAPGHLHENVLDETMFLKLCPRADDIWLKTMAEKAGVPCRKVAPRTFRLVEIRFPRDAQLSATNLFRDGNDAPIQAVADIYGALRGDR